MLKGDFQKELLDLLTKHGMKADDIESDSNDAVEPDKASKAADGASSAVVANLADSIASKLVAAIEKNRPDKVSTEDDRKSLNHEIKSRIFTNWGGMKEITYPSDLVNLTKEEKIVNFFKALVYSRGDEASRQVLRALTETDSEGGYLVPEELRTEVFRVLPDMVIMRNIARVLPMSTDTLKINSLTARPVAYWTAEYGSKSTTSAEFGQVTLSPNDLVCLLPISEQLLADANINLVQFITELFAEAIGLAEDKAFFTGSGTGQPKGINQESLKERNAGGTLDFDDIIGLIGSVPQRVRNSPRAAFVGSSHVKDILRGVKDQDNRYIWRDGGMTQGETGPMPDRLYGRPFYEQNDLAQSELYFGDWSFYLIGDRQTISVRTTTEGGEAWRRNSMEIKAVERVDGKAVITTPFAKITNA